MALALAHRRTYFNRCNPDLPLDPKDDRNHDIDEGGGSPRGGVWVDQLAAGIELSDAPLTVLFTGLPGSGKSTELRRLTERLQNPDGANLLPVLVDAEELLDLDLAIDVPDILLAALYRVDRAVLLEEGRNPGRAMKESLFQRVSRWWTRGSVDGPTIEASAKAGAPDAGLGAEVKSTWTLKSEPSLLDQLRKRAALQFGDFLADIRKAFSDLDLRVHELDPPRAGIVLVFDSLEKLRGLTHHWSDVLASAERLFRNDALRLPIHTVYTVPPALTFRLAQPVAFMPMIKLNTRPEETKPSERYAPGYAAAAELIRKRVPDEHLAELLGPEFEARREELIRWSGGYPRELVRLVQNLFTSDDWTDAAFKRFLERQGEFYRRIVPDTAYEWLAEVHVSKRVVINDANRTTADQMLSESVVLRYCNDVEWFDLHPAILDIDGLRAAIARREKPQPSAGN